MTTPADELNDLLRQQAEHEAAASEAADRVATYEMAMFAEQVARREEWCREFVDSYESRVSEIKVEHAAAFSAFLEVASNDPTIKAWVRLRVQHLRLHTIADQQANALINLDRESEVAKYRAPSRQEPRLLDDLLDVAEDQAHAIVDEERSVFDEERERYALEGERP